jgi:hypothetical protein
MRPGYGSTYFRASSMVHCKLSNTRKKWWKAFKYSSPCNETLVHTLYFLFILSSPSCLLRLSLNTRTKFWQNLIKQFSWRSFWLVYHIFGVCVWYMRVGSNKLQISTMLCTWMLMCRVSLMMLLVCWSPPKNGDKIHTKIQFYNSK